MEREAFESVLEARGAVLQSWGGRRLPRHFGDPGREWRAAREGCAVLDGGLRSLAVATGEDRVSFLQGMLCNDVEALAAGQGMHAGILSQQGKVLTDLRVYADAERIVLDVLAPRLDAGLESLDRYLIADEVELVRDAGEVALLGIEGPLARPMLTEVLGAAPAEGPPYSHTRVSFAGAPLRAVVSSEIGARGYLLCGPASSAAPLLDALCEAGAVPLGMESLEVLRVEGGVPWPGVDMDEDTLVMEVGLDDAISFTKGCYLGQEVVERIAARGHVNRRLRGLRVEGAAVPAAGAVLRSGEREVGRLTSAVRSNLLESVIGLGYVMEKHVAADGRVSAVWPEGEAAATVVPLPFRAQGDSNEEE